MTTKLNAIDTVRFSKAGPKVTMVGLGGEGVLRTHGRQAQARQVIQSAVDNGISYFDSARVYADSETYYGSLWRKHPEIRSRIFQASKSAARDAAGAEKDLAETLERLGTDYLDLWQIHDIRTINDLITIAGPGGALHAFLNAKKAGRVRFIGVTGHHDPEILTRAVQEWPVDSVMLPVNPIEGLIGGFLTSTLPAAKAKGMAVIGMKILGASYYVHLKHGVTAELLIRYALSQDITVAIVGCSSSEEATALADTGRGFKPLSDDETAALLQIFQPYTRQLAFYRGVI